MKTPLEKIKIAFSPFLTPKNMVVRHSYTFKNLQLNAIVPEDAAPWQALTFKHGMGKSGRPS